MSSQDKTGAQDGSEDAATEGHAQDPAAELPETSPDGPETLQDAAETGDWRTGDGIEDAELVADPVAPWEDDSVDGMADAVGSPGDSPAAWDDALPAADSTGDGAVAWSDEHDDSDRDRDTEDFTTTDGDGDGEETSLADADADADAEDHPDPDTAASADADSATDDAGDAADLTVAATAALAGAAATMGATTGAGGNDAEPAKPATPTSAPTANAAPQKSRGGFVPALLGGVVAAGIGFGTALYMGGDLLGDDDALEQALAAQDDKLSALDARLGEIAEVMAAPADTGTADQIAALGDQLGDQLGDVGARIDTLAGTVDTVQGGLTSLDARLDGLDGALADATERLGAMERRPLTESSEAAQAAFTAYERDLEELRAELDEQTAVNAELAAQLEDRTQAAQTEIEAAAARAAELQAQAEEQARVAAAQAEEQARIATEEAEARANAAAIREALASLDSALEKGAPFAEALAVLGDHVEVPQALTDAAADGVDPLPDLRATFPDLARDALDASIRETVSDDVPGRAYAFLLSQTGLRSLEPREGDDPDAVLSRAEAALDDNDLAATLAELDLLPAAGREVLSDWMTRAEQRRAVTEAAATLADTLLAN